MFTLSGTSISFQIQSEIYMLTICEFKYVQVNFKWCLTSLNPEFSFSQISCHIKIEELCYILIAGGRIVGYIPSPRVLSICEMQTASSRI